MWYEGIVIKLFDDNKQDEKCEFTVKYNGYKDLFQGQLDKERCEKCVIVKCKALLDESEKKEKFELFLHHHLNSPILPLKKSIKESGA